MFDLLPVTNFSKVGKQSKITKHSTMKQIIIYNNQKKMVSKLPSKLSLLLSL